MHTRAPRGLSITSVAESEVTINTQSWFHFHRQDDIFYSKCSQVCRAASFVLLDKKAVAGQGFSSRCILLPPPLLWSVNAAAVGVNFGVWVHVSRRSAPS